jgi:trans-aconitate 2-methyltransferase
LETLMPHTWDPERYLTYADERGRPFFELIARIDATAPAYVVDLGCGPGNLTRLLADRWPGARVEGVDSSVEMIDAALRDGGDVAYRVGDVATWRAEEPVDVLISNATFQWVPGHLELLPRLLDQVRPGGWFAFGVPGNFDEPSHVLRAELAAEAPYAEQTAGVASPDAFDATTYLELLSGLGCTVDAWETTYLHTLTGPDPVFTWISGTSARPTLQALDAQLRPAYEAELKRRLDAAYVAGPAGVVLSFRRVFVVARKGD